jgi:hypothetical protein
MNLSKKQLRSELRLLNSLVDRYGGQTSLYQAHDNVAVALDLYRGLGGKPKKATKFKNSDFFDSTKVIKKKAA